MVAGPRSMPPTMMSPGFLPAFFSISASTPVIPPCWVPIAFRFGMALDVGGEHRHASEASLLTSWRDLQPVDLEPGLLKRVGQTFLGLAPLGLAEHAVDHGFVAGLEALGEHGLGGELAAGIEVDTGIAHALRAEIFSAGRSSANCRRSR